jgi:DNA polymerase-4
VRYGDFTTITRSVTLPATRDREAIVQAVGSLLERSEAGHRPVRLLGVSVKNFCETPAPEVASELVLPFDPPE